MAVPPCCHLSKGLYTICIYLRHRHLEAEIIAAALAGDGRGGGGGGGIGTDSSTHVDVDSSTPYRDPNSRSCCQGRPPFQGSSLGADVVNDCGGGIELANGDGNNSACSEYGATPDSSTIVVYGPGGTAPAADLTAWQLSASYGVHGSSPGAGGVGSSSSGGGRGARSSGTSGQKRSLSRSPLSSSSLSAAAISTPLKQVQNESYAEHAGTGTVTPSQWSPE